MTRKTASESLFESFCDQNAIRWESIPTLAKEQEETPDYYVYIGQQKIVCEIKQIDPSEEEIDQQRIFEAGGLAISGSTPGIALEIR